MAVIEIETELYPTSAQLAALTRQQDIASDLWGLLARQAQADLYGLDVALAALRHNATPSFGALARPPITRTATQRTAEVRALARDLAWLRDLGVVSLDDLVAEFSRRARRGEITPERPEEHWLLLGSLARPLWPQQVELGDLDTPVVAALYTLPAAARRAVSTWRARFAGRLLHLFTENAEFLGQHRYSLSYTRCNF